MLLGQFFKILLHRQLWVMNGLRTGLPHLSRQGAPAVEARGPGPLACTLTVGPWTGEVQKISVLYLSLKCGHEASL